MAIDEPRAEGGVPTRAPPEEAPAPKAAGAFVPAGALKFLLDNAAILDLIDWAGGLFPGVGDTITGALNMAIPILAYKQTGDKSLLTKMVWITVKDWLVGLIPIVGDILDIFIFRSNTQCRQLLGYVPTPKPAAPPSEITKAYEAKARPLRLRPKTIILILIIAALIASIFFVPIPIVIGIGLALLLIYGFATGGINLAKLTPKNIIAIFLILLLVGVPIYYMYFAEREMGEGWLTAMVQGIVSLPARFVAWWTEHSPAQALERFYEKQIAIAVGDYYTGTVDANAEEELGVFLENLEPASKYFYETERVTVWATVRARSLDVKRPLNISFSCYAEDVTKKNGSMTPPQVRGVFLEDIDLNCDFERGRLAYGTKPVTIKASFDFATMSYLKNYFMSRERLQALKRREIDPFMQYGITDVHPIAIYTAGPVGIGMDTTAPLLGISAAYAIQPKLGITLENKWRGKIKKLNDLTIKIPEGMNLTGCDYNIKEVKGSEAERECEAGRCKYSKVYKMQKSKAGRMGKDRVKDVTTFVSFRCRIGIEPGAIPDILGRVPVATHFFKVTADYTYELEKATTVRIKAGDGIKASLDNCDKTCVDADGCICPVGCKEAEVGKGSHCGGVKVIELGMEFEMAKCSAEFECDGYATEKECNWNPCRTEFPALKCYSWPAFGCRKCGATCEIYIIQEYCEFDPCGVICEWKDGKCVSDTKPYDVGKFRWPSDTLRTENCVADPDSKGFLQIPATNVYAVKSGYITSYDATKGLTIHHNGAGPANPVTYKNIEAKRTVGNVKKGDIIGTAKDRKLLLKMGEQPLNYFNTTKIQIPDRCKPTLPNCETTCDNILGCVCPAGCAKTKVVRGEKCGGTA